MRGVLIAVTRMLHSRVSQNFLILFLRFLVQFLSFFLVARSLLPDEFGAFATALSVSIIVGPLVELGGFSLAASGVANGQSPNYALAMYFFPGLRMAVFGVFISLAIIYVVLKGDFLLMAAFVILGEVAANRLNNIVSSVHIAADKTYINLRAEIMATVLRVTGALVVVVLHTGVLSWAMFNCFAYIVSLCTNIFMHTRYFGKLDHRVAPTLLASIKSGWSFALGINAQTIYSESDKSVLARWVPLDVVGSYGVGTRVMSMILLPVLAVLNSIHPRFFDESLSTNRRFDMANRVSVAAALYAAVAVVLVFFSKPIFAFILPRYENAWEISLFFAFNSIVVATHFVYGDFLSGIGLQKSRALMQIGAAMISLAANIMIIPKYGYRGSALIYFIVHLVLSSAFFIVGKSAKETVVVTRRTE